ncbi:MlaD family protein [Nocardia inohanensis]|uniref:MlaD family protein n=1 Tax=Nocardia inohanensis TaxID=209246 RepID=UPI00082EEDC2|nr:MlaD family protein [Nocardia inohanensis]
MIELLTRPLRRRSGPPPDDAAQRRLDIRWGALGLAAIVAAAIAITVVSTVQLGVGTYTAYLTDASALRVGDEVRLAGVTVGQVKSIDLEADRVRMRFTVDDEVFLGEGTTLDVRMLTIVGGHYLAVRPAGDKPLGRKPIPADHVVLPYSLPRIFQDAVRPVEQLDGDVLRRNLDALAQAVDGSPDGFRRMVTAVDTVVGLLAQQNQQVSLALSVSDEYLSALAANKSVVGKLIARFRILETLVENNKVAVGSALDNLATVLSQAAPLARGWTGTAKEPAQVLADTIPKLDELGAKLGALLDSLRTFGERLQSLGAPAPAVCVPTPARSC